ncbi:LOW QUALITY PROTEIN: olfactory receptor 13H1-like [Rhineura floridana]|uniref:LOW QUALITY PROTEIN: olfactory receptor 13H1-like n=1 Tax=Rhineura floridana TaxID=261503 RepID=UPI002AC85062|nr:LOW QUALITY PROTEIN: olfactory receptor 13H1-like [Rhineura floridana]
MEENNDTAVAEFILLGLSGYPKAQAVMFAVFLVVYLVTLLGNGLMVVLIIVSPLLHTPMYFFLSNLSFLDMFYTTCSVPQMLVNCFAHRPTVSFVGCLAQMYITLFLGIAECFLLAVMAYDRFAAVCSPLHYTLIMSRETLIQLAATSWAFALLLTLIAVVLQSTCFCGHNIINHFTCELQAFLKVACSNTRLNDMLIVANSFFVLIMPFCFILVTYGRIALAVMHIKSAKGQSKAFSTCGSHVLVVTVFYCSAMSMYLHPQGKVSSNRDKMISVFYGAVTPMLNPLIYSLRNKDVKGAFWRLLGGKIPE